MVKWIGEKYNMDVVTFTVDLGQGDDLDKIKKKDLRIIAPVREWKWTRDEEIRYAQEHGIEVEAKIESPYSIDQNLFGRSCEAGVLEDPWDEPPAEAYAWSVDPAKAPNEPLYVEIEFQQGRPV